MTEEKHSKELELLAEMQAVAREVADKHLSLYRLVIKLMFICLIASIALNAFMICNKPTVTIDTVDNTMSEISNKVS